MVQKIVQPRLIVEIPPVSWGTGQIILEHLMNAKEPPTFTMSRVDDGVKFWFSKRTYDWLKRVLAMDPRAHKED
jgi:hypothetical protein